MVNYKRKVVRSTQFREDTQGNLTVTFSEMVEDAIEIPSTDKALHVQSVEPKKKGFRASAKRLFVICGSILLGVLSSASWDAIKLIYGWLLGLYQQIKTATITATVSTDYMADVCQDAHVVISSLL